MLKILFWLAVALSIYFLYQHYRGKRGSSIKEGMSMADRSKFWGIA